MLRGHLCGLFRRTRMGDHGHALVDEPGDQQRSHAAGRRVHERCLACGCGKGVLCQIAGRQPLEHDRRGRFRRHAFGDANRLVGGDQPVRGIGTAVLRGADALADGKAAHAIAQRDNPPDAFGPQMDRQGIGIEPFAVIGIDEVEPYGLGFDQDFTGAGGGDREVFPFEDFRAAVGLHDDAVSLWHIQPIL